MHYWATALLGYWALELRTTGALLGWCGLRRPETAEDGAEVDLGYRLFRRYRGHGYATEATQVCLVRPFVQLL